MLVAAAGPGAAGRLRVRRRLLPAAGAAVGAALPHRARRRPHQEQRLLQLPDGAPSQPRHPAHGAEEGAPERDDPGGVPAPLAAGAAGAAAAAGPAGTGIPPGGPSGARLLVGDGDGAARHVRTALRRQTGDGE